MNLFKDVDECCGCGACVNKCPQYAIEMRADAKGFYYPKVNSEKCINCELCLNVCDFQNRHTLKNNIVTAYAMQHLSKEVVKNSSSGGAFTAISDFILSVGGYVYGAVFDKNFEVHHIEANTYDLRNKMRGSKYIQSQMGSAYQAILQKLQDGAVVLFTGTPCQCAALCSYLGGHPDNLYIVDLICHGVPSNQLLQDHIHFWEKKVGKKAVDYQYRSKKYGYESTHNIKFFDGTSNSSIDLKRLLKLYEHTMRPSCYNCKYTSRNRTGDITIGDLWEAGKIAHIYDHRGTSVITVNTEKGKLLIEKIRHDCKLIEIPTAELKQNAFSFPVQISSKSEQLWKDYFANGYEFILNKYAPYTVKSWGYAVLWRLLYLIHLDEIVVYLKSKR